MFLLNLALLVHNELQEELKHQLRITEETFEALSLAVPDICILLSYDEKNYKVIQCDSRDIIDLEKGQKFPLDDIQKFVDINLQKYGGICL